jgi:peptide/nickel transport system substrate-binding protein
MAIGSRAAALAAMSFLAAGAAGGQTLSMGVGSPITSLDPHFHQLAPNNAFADMVYGKLVETDERDRNVPGLAVDVAGSRADGLGVQAPAERHLPQRLPLHGEDVAFTLQRLPNVPNSPSSFAAYARVMSRVEIVDPLTIRFHTPKPLSADAAGHDQCPHPGP